MTPLLLRALVGEPRLWQNSVQGSPSNESIPKSRAAAAKESWNGACRALCEEDVGGSSASVRHAAGEEGDVIMPRGALEDSGLRSTDAYLTRKAGMFCDVVERLAHSHMEVGIVT